MQWEKSFGGINNEWGKKVLQNAKDDILVIGKSNSGNGDIPSLNGFMDFTLSSFDKFGQNKWTRTYGTKSNYAEPNNFALTKDGGCVIIGTTSNLCRSNVPWSKGTDIWIVKVDSTGVIQWDRCFGSTDLDQGTSVIQQADGTYIVSGNITGNDLEGSGNHGKSDIWIAKLNATGDIIWNKLIGGTHDDTSTDIEQTIDGGFVLVGFTASNDGDISGNHDAYNTDALVIKFSASGLMEWNKCYGGQGNEKFYKLAKDNVGNFYGIGSTSSFHDGDVLGGDYNGDIWITKIQSNGDLKWEKSMGGTNFDEGKSIILTKENTLAVGGMGFSKDGDFNTNVYGHTIWVAKLSVTDGIPIQQSFWGGTSSGNESKVNDLVEAKDGGIIVLSTTNEKNPYVHNYKGGLLDIWLFKLNEFNAIKGTVYIDKNGNGIKETSESYFNDGKIIIRNPSMSDSSIISTLKGHFYHTVDTGIFNTSYLPTDAYYTVTPTIKSSAFSNYSNIDSFAFRLVPIPGKADVSIKAWSIADVRMGVENIINIFYKNNGTEPATSVINFVKDSRTSFVSSSIVSSSILSDTITFNLKTLQALDSGNFSIILRPAIPPVLGIDSALIHKVSIKQHLTDFTPLNNEQIIQQKIRGSYDPNDKQEISKDGNISTLQISNGESLTYMIRFQNLGNDTAFKVVVRDTIGALYDLNSFEMVASSHPFNLIINKNGVIQWTFEDIRLIDHIHNEIASHGYIIYAIKPIQKLSISDTIRNSASIYFDFNLPVKTNTHELTVKEGSQVPPVISGLLPTYCNALNSQIGKINNLPVAGNGTTISVDIDGIILNVAPDSTFSFMVNTLSVGQHTIKVTYNNKSGSITTKHSFIVIPAITPNVNLTSNIYLISDTNLPIIITAINNSGGGTRPLYTFAKDRNMANVIQTEGTATTLTVSPNTMSFGNNWIYVQMKTSENCFSRNTDVDSIKIFRDQSTGIIDLDNPGQEIRFYPNPFKNKLTLRGLSLQKIYFVTITNIHGQELYKRKISNQSSVEIRDIISLSGIYWLSLYDLTKGKSIGVLKLVKE